MSSHGSVGAEAIVQVAPKTNAKSETGDPIDRVAQAILGLVHRTATDTKAKNQHTLGMSHQLSDQLRAAEERIRELEAQVRQHQEAVIRAEKWLYRISLEMEQQFLGRDAAFSSQLPSPQALLRSQRQ